MRFMKILDYMVILLVKLGTLSFAKKLYLRGWIGIGGIAYHKRLPYQLVFDYCHINEEIMKIDLPRELRPEAGPAW